MYEYFSILISSDPKDIRKLNKKLSIGFNVNQEIDLVGKKLLILSRYVPELDTNSSRISSQGISIASTPNYSYTTRG